MEEVKHNYAKMKAIEKGFQGVSKYAEKNKLKGGSIKKGYNKYLGTVAGAGLGFILGDVPGSIAGGYAGYHAGKRMDR